jgi:hypothetical protein
MKQGRATHSGSGSTKSETISHGVPPAYPAGLGLAKGNHADRGTFTMQKIPMYEGRGLEAPMVGVTTHQSGSQGKHK